MAKLTIYAHTFSTIYIISCQLGRCQAFNAQFAIAKAGIGLFLSDFFREGCSESKAYTKSVSRTEIAELEKSLGNISERLLLGVALKYGKDSSEYEMAGGVRKSDRVRKSLLTRLKTAAEEKSKDNAQSA